MIKLSDILRHFSTAAPLECCKLTNIIFIANPPFSTALFCNIFPVNVLKILLIMVQVPVFVIMKLPEFPTFLVSILCYFVLIFKMGVKVGNYISIPYMIGMFASNNLQVTETSFSEFTVEYSRFLES